MNTENLNKYQTANGYPVLVIPHKHHQKIICTNDPQYDNGSYHTAAQLYGFKYGWCAWDGPLKTVIKNHKLTLLKDNNDETNTDSMKTGDCILVRNSIHDVWKKRIFIAINPINKQFICVDSEDEKLFKNSSSCGSFRFITWSQGKVIPKYEPPTLKLNHTYSAIVNIDHVKVGCQEFSFEVINKLNDLVNIAKNIS